MVRKFEGLALCVAGFAGLMLLTGCAGTGPRDTTYQWRLARDQQPQHHEVRSGQRTSDANDRWNAYGAGASGEQVRVPIVPTPKPVDGRPAWYAETVAPAHDQIAADEPVNVGGPVRFRWPVEGRVISDFGTSASGERNDGINIAAKMGTPIRAAATGTVTYAGDELRNYGNLILIKHADGYVTAYAHASSLIVARGDRVTRGQVIGYTGDSGDVSEPQLHFEIRKGTSPIDPRPLLLASS